jgi:hypothetical protein
MPVRRTRLRPTLSITRTAMKTIDTADVRPFYRSEAFPEDVADLVESATVIAARRARSTSRPSWLWLLSLLPIGAAAGLTVALLQKLL